MEHTINILDDYSSYIVTKPDRSIILPEFSEHLSKQITTQSTLSDYNNYQLLDPDTYINKINESYDYSYEILNKNMITKSYESRKENLSQKIGILASKNWSPLNLTPNQNSLSPNFMSTWTSGFVDLDAITPSELPEKALPILDFMEQVKPHIVIGCDRGGRLFGLAIHAAWQQTRPGQPFPTLDGKLHFARVSKSEDKAVLQEKIDAIMAMSKQFGKQRGNEVADGEQLRVLFIDDWVIGGGTAQLAKELMHKYDAETYFGVMCGPGADVTGDHTQRTGVSWHDKPEEIGVNYLSGMFINTDDSVSQSQKAVAVRAPQAVKNRNQIFEAAKRLSQPANQKIAA